MIEGLTVLEGFLTTFAGGFLACFAFNHIWPQNPVYITNAYASSKEEAIDFLNGIDSPEVEVEQDWID